MKVAIYHNLPSGGAKRALQECCRVLARRGVSLDLFVPETADEGFLPLDGFVGEKVVLPLEEQGRTLLNIRLWKGYEELLRRMVLLSRLDRLQRSVAQSVSGNYDLAFVHHCRFSQAPSLLRYLDVPSVYFCQEVNRSAYELPPDGDLAASVWRRDWRRLPFSSTCLTKTMLRRMERRNIQAATVVVANSNYSREQIAGIYAVHPAVVYLGVDAEKFQPLGVPREDFVLSVGGFTANKGFRFLISAVGMIDPEIRPRLVLIGDRGDEAVIRDLEAHAVARAVRLSVLSRVDEATLVSHYNRALAVIYAPIQEPFGFVPLEAMACGTPVIGVREGGVRETVLHGETGLLVKRDEGAFAAAIGEVLTNVVQREAWGRRGVAVARERWSWEKTADRLITLFESAVDRKGLAA